MVTMTGNTSSGRRLSAWELRERLKKSRSDISTTASTGRQSAPSIRCRSLDDMGDADADTDTDSDLPPAFRGTAGRKGRRSRSTGGYRRRKEEMESSQHRRTSIIESMEKFELEASFRVDNEKYIERDPYADDKSMGSLGTKSLSSQDSEPPPAEHVTQNTTFGKSISSFDASLDLSTHGRHKTSGDIVTPAVSDDLWARFKLLGRIGLGDIEVSAAVLALIERNVDKLLWSVKKIVAMRDNLEASISSWDLNGRIDFQTGNLLDEVKTTIEIPKEKARFKRDPKFVVIEPEVETQLRDYVTVISAMYRDNPFHNFEHASNVLLMVDKLVGYVESAEDADYTDIHDISALATEPWNHFALAYSALIHDVDHSGVPNAQLIKEHAHVAGAYKNKSVAEQNSIELAWNLLMEPCYKELRETIFLYPTELSNFRGLVITTVMATDIADKELAALRKGRAADALNVQEEEKTSEDLVSRKATFVMETLIQAADVSHTMAPFAVYKKWNHRLYREMLKAFKADRAENDPTESWYRGEFGFFDYYIVPLSKKLNDCGVAKKACEEWLDNALSNRKNWEAHGEDILEAFVAEATEAENVRPKMSLMTMARRVARDDYSSEESPLNSDFSNCHDESSDSNLDSDISSVMEEENKEAGPRPQPPTRKDAKPMRKKAKKKELSGKKLKAATLIMKAAADKRPSVFVKSKAALAAKGSIDAGAGEGRRTVRRIAFRSAEPKLVDKSDEKISTRSLEGDLNSSKHKKTTAKANAQSRRRSKSIENGSDHDVKIRTRSKSPGFDQLSKSKPRSKSPGSEHQSKTRPRSKSPGSDQLAQTNKPRSKSLGSDQLAKKNKPRSKSPGSDQLAKKNKPRSKSPGSDQLAKKNKPRSKSPGSDQLSKTRTRSKSPGSDQLAKTRPRSKSPESASGSENHHGEDTDREKRRSKKPSKTKSKK